MISGVQLLAKSKLPELSKYLRYFALGTAAGLALLGLLGIILSAVGPQIPNLWAGVYSLILAPIVFIVEFPFVPVAKYIPELFWTSLYFRAAYLILSICTFFNRVTIVCGVALLLLGLAYCAAAFRGEKPVDPREVGAPKEKVGDGTTESHSTAGTGGDGEAAPQRTGMIADLQRGVRGAFASVKEQVGKTVVSTATSI